MHSSQDASDIVADRDRRERLRLRYDHTSRPDLVNIRGFRVLWALRPTDSVLLVPGSHKTDEGLAPPSLHRIEEMGSALRPTLAAGDCLLCAATTLVGLRSREYTAPSWKYPPAFRSELESTLGPLPVTAGSLLDWVLPLRDPQIETAASSAAKL